MINQILELGGSDELSQATKVLNKVLDEIMLAPVGPKRWRAVVDVLFKTNPIAGEDLKGQPISFRVVNHDCVVENQLMRESASDKWGHSLDNEKSNFRGYLRMPRIVHTTIEQCDPMAFKSDKNAQRMFNALPEYRTAAKH